MNVKITAIAYSLAKNTLGNKELAERFGADVVAKIEKFSGILERRVALPNECASDFAYNAAKLIIDNTALDLNSVDLLTFATQTPDYIMPTTACILQERLNLPKKVAAYDINLGCSQFIYSLANAAMWVASPFANKALVLTGDTPTRLLNKNDKSSVALFGDGACAFLLEKSDKDELLDFNFGSDGAGYNSILCRAFSMRNPPKYPADYAETCDENVNVRRPVDMFVDGFKIFAFAYKNIADSVSALLEKNSLKVSDIDLFVFHQAGQTIVSGAAKRLGISPDKVYYKMHDIGNCGGSSVGIALCDAVLNKRLKPKMKVVLCAFGVGLSWGSVLLEWNNTKAFTDADYSNSPQKPQSQTYADLL